MPPIAKDYNIDCAEKQKAKGKIATVDYLCSHFEENYTLDKIYYYTDKLYNTQQVFVQEMRVEYTRKILGGNISMVINVER